MQRLKMWPHAFAMGWNLSLTRSGRTFQRKSSYTMPISAYGPTAWIAKKKKPEAAPLSYHAAYIGFHEIVEHLILKYPHYVNTISGSAGTALHSASTSNAGHVKVLHSLLKYGADVNARGAFGHDGPAICVGRRSPSYRTLLTRPWRRSIFSR